MTKLITWTILCAMAALAMAPAVMAEEAASVAVTLTGTNYNLLDTLAADAKADAPAELAKINALKVSDAKDAEGKAIEGLKGKTVHYVPSAAAAALLSGDEQKGKKVTVKGKLFADANTVLVESFEAAAGGDDDWSELDLNTLSGQQVL
ncbi:MAG: hypothetical protein GC168_06260 [Candidatus Hydrogenedens sp.]|nr:hypothetical protein [Candidatus Hydrogenedens sp.]